MISVNAQALVDWLARLGAFGMALLALVGFQQGWWRFGREVDDLKAQLAAMTQDRNEWKVLAMASMHAGERSVQAATAVVTTAGAGQP